MGPSADRFGNSLQGWPYFLGNYPSETIMAIMQEHLMVQMFPLVVDGFCVDAFAFSHAVSF